MSNKNDFKSNVDDNELNSVVDEFFSFIYNEPGSDEEMGDSQKRRKVDLEEYGCSLVPHDNYVDEVFNEHFSFLNDEPSLEEAGDEFYSLDVPPTLKSSTGANAATISSDAPYPYVGQDDEPIYTNISALLSVRPKSRNEEALPQEHSLYLNLPLHSEPEVLVPQTSEPPSDVNVPRKKNGANAGDKIVPKDQSEYKAAPSEVNLVPDEENRITENIYQIGNKALIKISAENDRRQEVIIARTDLETDFPIKLCNEIRSADFPGKSSVYVSPVEARDWKKRQRRGQDPEPASPLTIRFKSDGQEPLVYALCTKADALPELLNAQEKEIGVPIDGHRRESVISPKRQRKIAPKTPPYEPGQSEALLERPNSFKERRFHSKPNKRRAPAEPRRSDSFRNVETQRMEQKTNANDEQQRQSAANNCHGLMDEEANFLNGASEDDHLKKYDLICNDIWERNLPVSRSEGRRSLGFEPCPNWGFDAADKPSMKIASSADLIRDSEGASSGKSKPPVSSASFCGSLEESERNKFLSIGEEETNAINKSEELEKISKSKDDQRNSSSNVRDKSSSVETVNKEIAHCSSERDFERLLSLDLELRQLENTGILLNIDMDQPDALFSGDNIIAEAFNTEVIPTVRPEVPLPYDISPNHGRKPSFKSSSAVTSNSDDQSPTRVQLTETISSSSELTDKEMSSVMRSLVRQDSVNYDNNELFLQSSSGDDVQRIASSRSSFAGDLVVNRTANEGDRVDNLRAANSNSGESPMDKSLGSALSGVLRRSMKRMKHIRLSGRRSRNRPKDNHCPEHSYGTPNVSEETEVRRRLPTVPQMGLSSVRSPTASAVLLPSILAALTPNEPPREMLPSPEEVMDQPRSQARSNTADYLNGHITHHRSCGTSHVLGSSTRPPRTNRTPPNGSELNSPSPEVEPNSSLSANPSSRNAGTADPPTGITAQVPTEILTSRIILESGMSPVQVPILRLPANGTPVPVHGRSSQNLPPNNNHTRRNNNRHSRDTRERHRIRQTDNTNNARNQSNNNNNTTATNNNNNNTPRRASRTPPRQSSSSHLSSEGDLRINSQRVRVGRPVTHSQGFRPPTRSVWPHGYSGLMASLPVTLNMFNISRFAVLGAAFGWQFPIQWFVISLVVALPLMAFHAAIGQAIGGSVIDMWVISPIFQGVGYALLFVEMVLGIYCCLPVAWLFNYFRDSFDMRHFRCISLADCATPANLTKEINTYVPLFFSSHILQRSDNEASVMNSLGSLKFDLSFNIALTWVITFLALSRGTRSYGKICYIIYIIPLLCYFTVCFYMIYWANNGLDMKNFGSRFIDRQPWLAASREAFLVWGLHGAVIQQMASGNKKRHPVWRDTTILAIITVCGLCFASFFGMLCVSALESKGLVYRPSSFESEDTRPFVDVQILYKDPETISMERNQILGPPQYLRPEPVYDNFYVGVRVRDDYLMRINPRIDSYRSGYNCLRFMTELFPALLFSKNEEIMSAWAPLFFLALLLFGLAQQLAVWHTVVQGVLRLNYRRLVAWETFITFCCCLFGFSAALPMASGAGIHIIYFLDYAIGSVWWIMILQLIMVFAVLFVRGKPYSAKDVAYKLFGEGSCCSTPWTVTPIAFFWTIIVPVGLLILSISSFKNGNYREVFTWASVYWSTLTCQIASTFQLFPLLLVPLVGLIQTCKYLADPRQDLFERIQHLYRPPLHDVEEDPVFSSSSDEYDPMQLPYTGTQSPGNEPASPRPYSDPPPKYTPPPSYSIATGSGFSKLFNRSFRTWRNTLQNQSTASAERVEAPPNPPPSTNAPTEPFIPPPDYSHQLHAYENPAIISDSSTSFSSPPQYATLDPLRMRRAFDAFRKGKSSLNSEELRTQRNETCRYCGFAQFYEFRSRRNSTGDVPSESSPTDTERFQTIEFSELETRSVETEDSDYVASIKHSCDTSSEYVDPAVSGCSSRSIPGNDVTFTSRFNARYHPGEELNEGQSAEARRRSSEQCTNPNCPGPSIPRHVINNLSRIASYPNSFKRSTSLRQSWTSSLRRSARRLAAAIAGTNSIRNRHCDGAILVSHVSNGNLVVAPSRSLSNLNIYTQSEA